MNKKSRYTMLFSIAAGIALIPIARAVIKKYRKSQSAESFSDVPPNNLFSAYRGKHKPHRRKADNGVH